MAMDDSSLLRYSRHILLDELGVEGQERLLASRVLVIGAGGLGSAALLYLASAGVGQITVADDDRVDLTNLQRQIAHTEERVGMAKAQSAAVAMQALNRDVEIQALQQRLEGEALRQAVARADVVLDCSDNYPTRQAVNAACVLARRPLVSGAAISFDAQVSVWDTRFADKPCYACVFAPDAEVEAVRCATMGVFAPLVGMIGALQAAEALRLLAQVGQSLAGRLQMLDARSMRWHELQVARDPQCPVCGRRDH